jgi:hypothetical protein
MDISYLEQKNKIKLLEYQLTQEIQLLQKVCPHESIKYYPSDVDYYGDDRVYYPAVIKCDDCDLFVEEKDKNFLEIKRKYNL